MGEPAPVQDSTGLSAARTVLLATHPGVQEDPGLRALLGQWILRGHAVRPCICDSPDSLTRAVAVHATEVDIVAAAGGDGTVRAVVQGIVDADVATNADPQLAVLAMGTGNDLARQLGLAQGPSACGALLDEGRPRPWDVARTDQGVFANMLSVGFAAQVTADTPRPLKDAVGGLAYLLQGVLRMGEVAPFEIEVQTDQGRWSGEALGVFVGNGSTAGGGRTVVPGADPADGMLDVRIVRPCATDELLALLARTAVDPGADDPALIDRRASHIVLTSNEPLPLNLDGEHAEAQRLEIHTLPGRLTMLSSVETPATR